jgi:hypothetical protein
MADTSTAYLATRSRTVYAKPLDPQTAYIYDRVAKTTTYEVKLLAPRAVSQVAELADSAAELAPIGQVVSFYDGDAFMGLPHGSVGAHGALTRSESLVLTEGILAQAYGNVLPPYLSPGGAAWPPEYPSAFQTSLAERAGHSYRAGDGIFARGYWVATERRGYDFHDPNHRHRGLLTTTRPPLGAAEERDTLIRYDDPYDLLANEVTDPAGLKQQAQYNYRILQPKQVTDANGNQTTFTFTPLGLLKTSAVRGKAGEGDDAHPSVTLDYDIRAFELRRQPVFVHSTRRVHHDSETDVPLSRRNETIETHEHSGGFGRLLQTRVQAEDVLFGNERFGGDVIPPDQTQAPGPIVGRQRANDAPPNVVVSGWQTYDNKGQVVEKWEPFVDQGWDHDPPHAEPPGAKVTMFYDPRGHIVRTVNPDGSEQRVIFGVPAQLDQPDIRAYALCLSRSRAGSTGGRPRQRSCRLRWSIVRRRSWRARSRTPKAPTQQVLWCAGARAARA